MKRSSDYHQCESQPRKLEKDEIASPYKVLDAFFDHASLPQVRDKLWMWLQCTVTGSFSKDLCFRDRAEILTIYQEVEKLIEAAHLIHLAKHNRNSVAGKLNKRKAVLKPLPGA